MHLFWQGLQEWGVKETGGNAVDPDTLAGKVPARHYQRKEFVHVSTSLAMQGLQFACVSGICEI